MASEQQLDTNIRPGHRPRSVAMLLVCLLAVLIPHVPYIPAWILALVAIIFGWRLLAEYYRWPLPGPVPKVLLVGLVGAGITWTFGLPTGRQAGTAFLIMMMALKLLELSSRRDLLLLVFLGYFLVITHFLRSQSIPVAIHMFLVVWLLTTAMVQFHRLRDLDWADLKTSFSASGALLLRSLPLMLVLFVLFPRISGPLWGLPEDAHAGTTGLSDEMSPGQISQLSQSTRIAFRVKFAGPLPPARQRYWRGLVLWEFSGFTWRTGKALPQQRLDLQVSGDPVRYEVTLEPHGKDWLFALDLPYSLQEKAADQEMSFRLADTGKQRGSRYAYVKPGYQLRANSIITQRRQYRVTSYPSYRTGAITRIQRQQASQLPATIDPRIYQLANQWRQQTTTDADLVEKAMAYFNEEPFTYTLRPPLLGSHPTAEFLFETRRGYCEHFASAFTVLMRAAGIPARVVTGYLGGELNPLDNYFIVRQLNAHAWSEVWLDGRGWVRVDPTSAVAPGRIEIGLQALPEYSIAPFGIKGSATLTSMWIRLRQGWDAVNNAWNQWVLSYTPSRQQELLQYFSLDAGDWQTMVIVLAGIIAGLLLIYASLLFRGVPVDPILAAYNRFCHQLTRQGIPRPDYEGPRDYGRRILRLRPEIANETNQILQLYRRLRYSNDVSRQDLIDNFISRVRRFNP